MDPGHHQSILRSTRDDALDVLDNIFLVVLQHSTTFPRVVAPRSEESGRELIVSVSRHFPNEEKLSFCNLVGDRRDVVEEATYSRIGNALFFDLCDPNAQDSADVPVEENLKLVE